MSQQYVPGFGLSGWRPGSLMMGVMAGNLRVRTRAERDVNDVSNKWTGDREIVLSEFGWYRIQSADEGF